MYWISGIIYKQWIFEGLWGHLVSPSTTNSVCSLAAHIAFPLFLLLSLFPTDCNLPSFNPTSSVFPPSLPYSLNLQKLWPTCLVLAYKLGTFAQCQLLGCAQLYRGNPCHGGWKGSYRRRRRAFLLSELCCKKQWGGQGRPFPFCLSLAAKEGGLFHPTYFAEKQQGAVEQASFLFLPP